MTIVLSLMIVISGIINLVLGISNYKLRKFNYELKQSRHELRNELELAKNEIDYLNRTNHVQKNNLVNGPVGVVPSFKDALDNVIADRDRYIKYCKDLKLIIYKNISSYYKR